MLIKTIGVIVAVMAMVAITHYADTHAQDTLNANALANLTTSMSAQTEMMADMQKTVQSSADKIERFTKVMETPILNPKRK